MSDVRDELIDVVVGCRNCPNAQSVADAILERFDVTPKPVISDADLGVFVRHAWRDETWVVAENGKQLRLMLEEAGLQIVRVDDHD